MIFPQGFEPLYEFGHDMKHPPGFTGRDLIDHILLIDHEFSFSTPTSAYGPVPTEGGTGRLSLPHLGGRSGGACHLFLLIISTFYIRRKRV
jgi:hypothetical protein